MTNRSQLQLHTLHYIVSKEGLGPEHKVLPEGQAKAILSLNTVTDLTEFSYQNKQLNTTLTLEGLKSDLPHLVLKKEFVVKHVSRHPFITLIDYPSCNKITICQEPAT